MLKKFAAIAGAGTMLLASTGPAFASHSFIGVDADVALIKQNSEAVSNTGYNFQGNGVEVRKAGVDGINVYGNNSMTTGSSSAYAGSLLVANTRLGCSWCDNAQGGWLDANVNVTAAKNTSYAGANTGNNTQGNYGLVKKAHADSVTVGGNNSAVTSPASATARTWTITNTHLSGFGH